MAMKRILITGTSRGLGRAMTDEFIRRGHLIWGCARDARAIAELAAVYPAPHRFEVVDVREDAAVAAWANRLLATGEAPDLLLNNAAVIHPTAPLWRIDAAEFDAVIDINVKGVANVLRHFLPAMIARGHGIVVNFSSGWGRSTDAEVAPYCASKWAIEGLTRALAQELPPGLAAIPVSPGIIDTDMLRRCFGPQAAAYPSPQAWAREAVPWLLGLTPRDSGRPLTVGEPH